MFNIYGLGFYLLNNENTGLFDVELRANWDAQAKVMALQPNECWNHDSATMIAMVLWKQTVSHMISKKHIVFR